MRLILGFLLVAVAAIGQPAGGGGSGKVTVKSNGVTIGSESVFSFPTPTGILRTITDDGTQLIFNDSVDPATVVTTKVGTIQMPAGSCNGGVAAPGGGWTQASGSVTCLTGQPSLLSYMGLTNVGTVQAANNFRWPSDFNSSGAVNVYLTFSDPGGSGGNIKLDLFIGCFAAGTVYNASPSYGTVTSTGSYSLTSAGSANTTKEVTVPLLNVPAACGVRSQAQLLVSRDNAVVGNSADALALIDVTLEYARN